MVPVCDGDDMTLAERALNYNRTFQRYPASHVRVVQEGRGPFEHDVLYATWLMGNDYRGTSDLYGSYPPGLLERLGALFPDRRKVLHAFSGSLPPGPYVRLDLHAARSADVRGDVCAPPFAEASFDMTYADPPYSAEDALRYDTPMVNRPAAIKSLARVTRPGGFLAWLDCVLPMYRKDTWTPAGRIAVVRSTSHRIRMVTIFQRRAA